MASPTLGSRLESLGISTDFCAGVLTARSLENGIRFGLGSTLAFRAKTCRRSAGSNLWSIIFPDDYEIGKRLAALGLEVKLSEVVVETFLPAYTLRGFLDHQLRWARCIRDSRRGGYAGLLLTFWTALGGSRADRRKRCDLGVSSARRHRRYSSSYVASGRKRGLAGPASRSLGLVASTARLRGALHMDRQFCWTYGDLARRSVYFEGRQTVTRCFLKSIRSARRIAGGSGVLAT